MAGEWLTPAEILELGVASLPTSMSKLQELIARENWRGDETRCRVRFGRGGGYEYHVSLLPSDARARVFAAAAPLATQAEARSQAEWAWFERLSEKAKETARQRLAAEVDQVSAIDETDAIVAEALGDYEEITDPLLMGLLNAVNGSSSFEEVLSKLDQAKIDSRPLARRLAIATAKARGLGDVKD